MFNVWIGDVIDSVNGGSPWTLDILRKLFFHINRRGRGCRASMSPEILKFVLFRILWFKFFTKTIMFCELGVVIDRYVHDPPVKLYQIYLSFYKAAIALQV